MMGLEPTTFCMASVSGRAVPCTAVHQNRLVEPNLRGGAARRVTPTHARRCHRCHAWADCASRPPTPIPDWRYVNAARGAARPEPSETGPGYGSPLRRRKSSPSIGHAERSRSRYHESTGEVVTRLRSAAARGPCRCSPSRLILRERPGLHGTFVFLGDRSDAR
jgi:hypothetical protein